jgi:hypothetical protein
MSGCLAVNQEYLKEKETEVALLNSTFEMHCELIADKFKESFNALQHEFDEFKVSHSLSDKYYEEQIRNAAVL